MSHLHHVPAALGRDGSAGDKAGDDLDLGEHVLAHDCERDWSSAGELELTGQARLTADDVELVLDLHLPNGDEELARDLGHRASKCQPGRGLRTQHDTHLESAEDRVQADVGAALKAWLLLDHAEHLAEDARRLVRLVEEARGKERVGVSDQAEWLTGLASTHHPGLPAAAHEVWPPTGQLAVLGRQLDCDARLLEVDCVRGKVRAAT